MAYGFGSLGSATGCWSLPCPILGETAFCHKFKKWGLLFMFSFFRAEAVLKELSGCVDFFLTLMVSGSNSKKPICFEYFSCWIWFYELHFGVIVLDGWRETLRFLLFFPFSICFFNQHFEHTANKPPECRPCVRRRCRFRQAPPGKCVGPGHTPLVCQRWPPRPIPGPAAPPLTGPGSSTRGSPGCTALHSRAWTTGGGWSWTCSRTWSAK